MKHSLECHTCITYPSSMVVEVLSVLNTDRIQLALSTLITDDITLFLYGVHSVKLADDKDTDVF